MGIRSVNWLTVCETSGEFSYEGTMGFEIDICIDCLSNWKILSEKSVGL